MNLDELQALMAEVAAGVSGAKVEVGRTDRPRYNDAFIKLTSPSDPETFATVSSGGGGVYELEVNGGFSTGIADDQSLEYDDVREYLESYVRAASAYLDGHWSIRKSRVLRLPILTIQKGGSRLSLTRRGHGSTNSLRLAF